MRVPHFLIAVVSLLCMAAATADAQEPQQAPSQSKLGGLLVAPTRVVFEGRSRTAVLTLSNPSAEAGTYRIFFSEMRMNEKGTLVEVSGDQAEGTSAASLVRYSPRQVTLARGESQTVRLQLRKPANLPKGEYRSHLTFRAVPNAPGAPTPSATPARKSLSISLTPVYGVAIPVIVRQGQVSATVGLSDVKLLPGSGSTPQFLELRINRTGDRSAYGDIVVTWIRADGRSLPLAVMKGVGVYAETPVRVVRLALSAAASGEGQLRVAFSDPDGSLIDDAVLPVR